VDVAQEVVIKGVVMTASASSTTRPAAKGS